MARLLYIECSPRKQGSASIEVCRAFLDAYRETLPADTFEALDTPLWAQRARNDLERASGARKRTELTASEQRVADLAATGATNREMAAALFISPKTVETNLSRIYRKLDIHSRAELGQIIGRVAHR